MVKSSLLGDRILNFVERLVERRVASTEQVRGGCLSVVVRCRSRVLVASWVVLGCVRCTAVVLRQRQRQGCDLRRAALCEARSRCLRTFVGIVRPGRRAMHFFPLSPVFAQLIRVF
jgi:hypothetical protein